MKFINFQLFCYKFFTIILLSNFGVKSDECRSSTIPYTLCYTNGTLIQNTSIFTQKELFEQCDNDSFVGSIIPCKDEDEHLQQYTSPTTAQRYGYGFLAVFIVSALSLIGLLAFPILYKASFQHTLALFTALAVGTLFGDSMFHLIPFALNLHGHDDHKHSEEGLQVPDHVWKMLAAVMIAYGFYLLEVLLHAFAHYKHKNNSVHFHAHGHSHGIPHHHHSHKNGEVCESLPVDVDADLEHSHQLHNHHHHNLHQHVSNEIHSTHTPVVTTGSETVSGGCVPCVYSTDLQPAAAIIRQNSVTRMVSDTDKNEVDKMISNDGTKATVKQIKFSINVQPAATVIRQNSVTRMVSDTDMNEVDKMISNDGTKAIVKQIKSIKATGWMVLIGDGIHNFADGLALGAAFSQDLILGATTTIAVGLHELPHELGDYAVLIQSGFSHYKAVLFNFISSLTSFIGFFIGVALSDNEEFRRWIFALTVGMFLYISLVDLLPTLLPDGEVKIKRFILVNIGFLSGILIMLILAMFEDKLIHSHKYNRKVHR